VNWHDPSLRIVWAGRVATLLTPADLHAVVLTLLAQPPDGLALAVAVILGGFGGLRRHEVCALELWDVLPDRRMTLWIRRSKTRMGRRVVPLGLLTPPWAREVLDAYAAQREGRAPADSAWLVSPAGHGWEPDQLGERVARVLRQVTKKRATFHALRRACATWLVVGSAKAFTDGSGPLTLDPDGPPPDGIHCVLGHDLARVLWGLARLLGHASPAVTVERYILGLDSVEALQGRSAWVVTIPRALARDVLRVGERRARQLLPAEGPGQVCVRDVLARVAGRMDQSHPPGSEPRP
jgi:integrase